MHKSLLGRVATHSKSVWSRSNGQSAAVPATARYLEVKVNGDNAQVEINPLKAYKCEAPSTWVNTTRQEVVDSLRLMMLMRRMEISADLMYKSQLIKGFCHLYDGQEAVAIGMEMGCTKKDSIVTSYRDHGWQLSRGENPKRILAELTGRSGGCTKGKGGSMHMYLSANNFWGGNGIVGAQVPLGAGLAFAAKYKSNKGIARGVAPCSAVAFALYGDGAANQGQVFEAVNMAYLWKLPVIFVIENNQYAMGTSIARGASNAEFYTRYDPLPGLKVDGMDAFSVKAATAAARKHCMDGLGPFVLEMNTYRYHGHSMSDPGLTYRSRDEVSNVRKERDPIDKLKRITMQLGFLDEGAIKEMEKSVRAEVDEAVEFAKTSPEPALAEMYTEVFTHAQPYVRGTDGVYGQGYCSWAPHGTP
mmetsp:Transcript_61970/g.166305  ORF Transcript_61970/g.166305 Transcript_61970/m.166305 type:complete len:417 (-) Transcript_61970:122-1372(-)